MSLCLSRRGLTVNFALVRRCLDLYDTQTLSTNDDLENCVRSGGMMQLSIVSLLSLDAFPCIFRDHLRLL